MIKKIVEFFNTHIDPDADDMPNDNSKRIALATCALMLEIAHADSEFDAAERDLVIQALKKRFDLTDQDAKSIIELAELERQESLDLWQFTNLINESFSYQDKLHVLKTLWSVVFADGTVDMHEEYLMRRLTNLLNLDHSDMIRAKLEARDTQNE
jgi:uncharacterized tellurite resistance protein B-like protein